LENLISQHPAVLEAAAIGVKDERWGERPVLYVVLKTDAKGAVTADELKRFMADFVDRGRLPRYAVPERIELVDALPKTSVGKLDKKRLRLQHA
jgi:fatty-acyl-CoA synthase